MRRWIAIAAAACAAIAVAMWLRCGGGEGAQPVGAGDAGGSASGPVARRRVDPATVARAGIAGTVTDATKEPIAGASVCAEGDSEQLADELLWAPVCATTDATGAYAIEGLLPARYDVSAAKRGFAPGARGPVPVAAGERVTGIDLALRAGGAELVGLVTDATGGPIAQALVVASGVGDLDGAAPAVTALTDAAGRFSLWVDEGTQRITAFADGYGRGWAAAHAPASIHIVLTPESTLSGVVVDVTTRRPIEGARVELGSPNSDDNAQQTAFTDERGEFRFRALDPGRVEVTARTERAYGRTAGTLLLGLGQHVTGVVIEVAPAFRVEARVLVGDRPCEEPTVTLDPVVGLAPVVRMRDAGGSVVGEGVLAGLYVPRVSCAGRWFVDQARLDVAGDVTGLVWQLPAGGDVRGRVLLRSGTPVAGQIVEVTGSMVHASRRTLPDGSFAFAGIAPGEAKLVVRYGAVRGPDDGESVTVVSGSTIERDLVVDETGTIQGTIVDADGAPVAAGTVYAKTKTAEMARIDGSATSDELGAFTMRGLRDGTYTISEWSEDDASTTSATATVRANAVTTVRITVQARRGVIRGVVRAGGAPVPDAYVSAIAEAGGDARQLASSEVGADPVLTATDGTFAIRKLGPGTYLVRAYRRGGGEAIAERVAVGSTVTLDIAATGSIAGTVRDPDGAPVDRLVVKVEGTNRMETFHRTAGRYAIRDLSPGTHTLELYARGARAVRKVTVGPGEAVTLDIALEGAVDGIGRFVDARTRAPVPNVYYFLGEMSDGSAGDDGRFTFEGIPPGTHDLQWTVRDQTSGIARITIPKGPGPVDLGDVAIPRPRAAKGGPVGDPGFEIDRELRILSVDPRGPAGASGLVAGDTITMIDGTDLTGQRWLARILLRAPPGTEIRIRVARGANAVVTLGPARR